MEVYLAQVFTIGNTIIDFYLSTNWQRVVFGLKVFSFLLSAGFIWAAIITLKKHRALLLEAARKRSEKGVGEAENNIDSAEWQRIEARWTSRLSAEKRLAIIEADALLDHLLRESGVEGETMIDRLRSPEAPQFSNMDEVGFAHKLRNELVHDINATFDPIDAERAMKAYEQALRELHVL